jgi:hypothetical protein
VTGFNRQLIARLNYGYDRDETQCKYNSLLVYDSLSYQIDVAGFRIYQNIVVDQQQLSSHGIVQSCVANINERYLAASIHDSDNENGNRQRSVKAAIPKFHVRKKRKKEVKAIRILPLIEGHAAIGRHCNNTRTA